MKIWKKALVVLVLAATVMGVAATQYAKLGVSFEYTIDTPTSLIQLMAGDGAVVGSGYVLTNNGGVYKVQLGTFAAGFNKTYTAAFAIVNAEANVMLRITKIDAGNTNGGQYLVIALHKSKDTSVFNTPSDGIIYFDKGTWYDYSTNGYVLANGAGTYDTTTTPLKYGDSATWPPASWTSATYDGTNHVWTPGSTVNADHLTTASGTTGANFVWVQITIDNSATAGTYTGGSIYIYVQSV